MNVTPRQLKQIRGIPYYVEGTDVYSFQVHGGKPSPDSILLGTYDAEHDCVLLRDDWAVTAQPSLDAYRDRIVPLRRDSFRQGIDKPEKHRASKRAARPSASRAKAPVCQ